MSRCLHVATTDCVRALPDRRVLVEGCDVNYLTMPVEDRET